MPNRQHLLHVRSNQLVDGKAKAPTAEQIGYGEIAVNYAPGYETLFVKNSGDTVVGISNRVQVGGEEPPIGSPIEIYVDTSVDSLTVDVYTKSEVDAKDDALKNQVTVKDDDSTVQGEIQVDETDSPQYEVYTKAQVDLLIQGLQSQIDELKS